MTTSRSNASRSRRWRHTLLGAFALVVLVGVATPAAAEPADPDVIIDRDLPGPDSPDEPPNPPPAIDVTDRTATTIELRWGDASQYENGYALQRRTGPDTWVTVAAVGEQSGPVTREDTGLTPDTQYCYRVRASNLHGSTFSPLRCAYTRAEQNHGVFRVQLRLQTVTSTNAGTDDDVFVRLTSSTNGTWLDYGRDDFERGDEFTYDLALGGIQRMDDITRIRIDKTEGDDWCVDGLTLLVNNVEVFAKDYGSECRWLDDGLVSHIDIDHGELRAHPSWQGYEPPEYPTELGDGTVTATVTMPQAELESRIEGMVGNLIHGTPAYWEPSGRAVEVSQWQTDILAVDLDLAASADLFGADWLMDDATLDVKFKIRFTAVQSELGEPVNLEVETFDVEADADTNWLNEFVFDILPCGPIATAITGEAIPGCASKFEDIAEDAAQSAIAGIHEQFDIPSHELCCDSVTVAVTETGDVEITVVFSYPGVGGPGGPLGGSTTAPLPPEHDATSTGSDSTSPATPSRSVPRATENTQEPTPPVPSSDPASRATTP